MASAVLLLGVFIVAVAAVMLLRPFALMPLVDKVFGGNWVYAAGLARFLLGALLIAAAPAVACSAVVEVLGWLFALGGLLLVVLPRAALQPILGGVKGAGATVVRCAALVVAALGGFFIYAALL